MSKKSPKAVTVSAAPKKAREIAKALVSECLSKNIKPTLILRSKHMRMEYDYRGQRGVVPFGCTPSCKRAQDNALADFRRQIREIDRCAA